MSALCSTVLLLAACATSNTLTVAGHRSASKPAAQAESHSSAVIVPATVARRQAISILNRGQTGSSILTCSTSAGELLEKLILAGVMPEPIGQRSTPGNACPNSAIDIHISTHADGTGPVPLTECIVLPHDQTNLNWVVVVNPEPTDPLHALVAAQLASDAIISPAAKVASSDPQSRCTLKSDAPVPLAVGQKVCLVFTPRCKPATVITLDRFGRRRLGKKSVDRATLADRLTARAKRIVILYDPYTLRSDLDRLTTLCTDAGISRDAVTLRRAGPNLPVSHLSIPAHRGELLSGIAEERFSPETTHFRHLKSFHVRTVRQIQQSLAGCSARLTHLRLQIDLLHQYYQSLAASAAGTHEK